MGKRETAIGRAGPRASLSPVVDGGILTRMTRLEPVLVIAALVTFSAAAHANPPDGSTSPGTQPASESAPGSASPATPPGRPPPYYYVEPPHSGSASAEAPARPPRVAEPPPPVDYAPIYEPPPPPRPHHIAPSMSLWLGARLGYFVPFGDLYGTCVGAAAGYCDAVNGTSWSQYASAGPTFELDGGMRLGRHYNVFVLWERAELGKGSAEPNAHGGETTGDSDFYALGVRYSSNPDHVGFLTEVDIGYRRFRAMWNDGTELQFTNAPFEFRLGLGADIRINRFLSLSPMATIGAGAFGNAQWKLPNGQTQNVTGNDQTTGHGWLTLQVGGHFDLFGSKR